MRDVRVRARRVAVSTGLVVARLTEFAMVAIGIWYNVVVDATDDQGNLQEDLDKANNLSYLTLFDTLVCIYLIAGFFVMRRVAMRRTDPTPTVSFSRARGSLAIRVITTLRSQIGQRLAFALTVIASLTGMTGAFVVVQYQDDPKLGEAFTALGVVAVVGAWMLLQVGYARFYRGLYYRPGDVGRGMVFPNCEEPGIVDFLYLSFTLGVSFAVSDVEIRTRRMRWHVLVHTVIAFGYNAAVLAIAISAVTGK